MALLAVVSVFLYSSNAIAQVKAKTEFTSLKQKGETVRYTVTSSKPFYFGNNRYVLYIGSKEFYRYEQSKKNGKGVLSFIIPAKDFKALTQGAPVYLNYGHIDIEETDMGELSNKSRKCWTLGKFDKDLLTK